MSFEFILKYPHQAFEIFPILNTKDNWRTSIPQSFPMCHRSQHMMKRRNEIG